MKTKLPNGVITDGTHAMVPHRLFLGLRGDQRFDVEPEGYVLRIDEMGPDELDRYGLKSEAAAVPAAVAL